MKSKLLFVPVILISQGVFSQISNDAVILTLRSQESIFLDSLYAEKIDSALESARNKLQIDSLPYIHALPDFIFDQLLLRTEAEWANYWNQGLLTTGEPFIDSLNAIYNLTAVDTPRYSISPYLLNYSQPLKIPLLSELFESHPDIIYAEANGIFGDGDNIELVDKDSILDIAFSIGRFDCPAGCIYRYYWYVSVDLSNGSCFPKLEEEREMDFSHPILYRWNIPGRYAMTMFQNVDSIIDSISNSNVWWVRRHAIEGIGLFFERTIPWVGEDIGQLWYDLKDELYLRVEEIRIVLENAVNDPDNDVKTSALKVLQRINLLSINEYHSFLNFSLSQNYPNPFNPSTKISWQTPIAGNQTLKVYDVLGNEVATLVDEFRNAGSYDIEFNPVSSIKNPASGVYFYQLKVGSFIQTKKMVLIK